MPKAQAREPLPVTFLDEQGRPVAAPEKYQNEAQLMQGNVFAVRESGKKIVYEMTKVNRADDAISVNVRPIKPKPWKGLVLAAALIATWFVIKYLGEWIFG